MEEIKTKHLLALIFMWDDRKRHAERKTIWLARIAGGKFGI